MLLCSLNLYIPILNVHILPRLVTQLLSISPSPFYAIAPSILSDLLKLLELSTLLVSFTPVYILSYMIY